MNRNRIATTPGSAIAIITPEPRFTGTASFAVDGAVVVIFSATVPEPPEPLNAPKTHAAPPGRPLHEKVRALLENPERDSVDEPVAPALREMLDGDADSFGVGGGVVGAVVVPG